MSFRFVNRPSVKTDIIDALNYYNKIIPNLLNNFYLGLKKQKFIFLNHL